MAPKFHQNCTKIVPRWLQDGFLEGFGPQDGAKRVPRSKNPIRSPMLGPKLGPHFRHFQHQGGSQEAWRPTWMTCCVQTPIFRRKGVSRDMKKQAKPLYCCSFSGFPLKWKKLLWRGVWGSILERFGCQVGPCWPPSWLKMALENHSKNWVVKRSCD